MRWCRTRRAGRPSRRARRRAAWCEARKPRHRQHPDRPRALRPWGLARRDGKAIGGADASTENWKTDFPNAKCGSRREGGDASACARRRGATAPVHAPVKMYERRTGVTVGGKGGPLWRDRRSGDVSVTKKATARRAAALAAPPGSTRRGVREVLWHRAGCCGGSETLNPCYLFARAGLWGPGLWRPIPGMNIKMHEMVPEC